MTEVPRPLQSNQIDLINVTGLHLLTGADISHHPSSGRLEVDQLAIEAAAGISLHATAGSAAPVATSVLAARNIGPGDIAIDNNVAGLLTIGTVNTVAGVLNSDDNLGGGSIVITNVGPIAVTGDVVNNPGGPITLEARENPSSIAAADLLVASGVTILSDAGVTLVAGDDLTVADNALITSNLSVLIWGDPQATDTDPGHGTTINVLGTVLAPNIEIRGGSDDDLINGGSSNERIEGYAGNDILSSGAGDDRLFGGPGDDVLISNAGNDLLDGGTGNDTFTIAGFSHKDLYDESGIDTLDFSQLERSTYRWTRGVTVDLRIDDGTVQYVWKDGTLSLNGVFENMVGSAYKDRLTGNDQDNLILGGPGDDRIEGLSGNDTLDGAAGDDLVFADSGDDLLIVSEGYDRLSGGDGSDTYEFRAPAYTYLIDQAGIDTLDFSSMPQHAQSWTDGVEVDLGIDSGTWQYVRKHCAIALKGDFENIIGTAFKDHLIGNDQDNLIVGGSGNDRIDGDSGDDTLDGDDGDDWLDGDSGDDTLWGGTGDDYMRGGSNNDLLDGGSGDDRLDGESGNDILLGAEGDDRLSGSSGRDVLIGGVGADNVSGDYHDDILIGGTTTFDQDPSTLQLIMSEWNSWRKYADRVDGLLAGTGPTGVQLQPDVTVQNDDDADQLSGGWGQDWFFADLDQDILSDVRYDEVVNSESGTTTPDPDPDPEFPWCNKRNRYDVNDDGTITPVDALLAINYINAHGSRILPLDRPYPPVAPFFDVNRDGSITPVDALLVINYMNGMHDAEGGLAETESDSVRQTGLPDEPLSVALSHLLIPNLSDGCEIHRPRLQLE